MFMRHLDRIERLMRPGRVLDVGCATGDFLKVARERGWDPLGVDPSPARELATAAGLRIVGRTIGEAQVEPASVDLITFWDVLEHLPNPVAVLQQAVRLLSPRGLIAVTVPDAGNSVARLSGQRWFGYKTAGEHLQFFNPGTLRRTFAAAGLEIELRSPVPWSCTVGFLVDRAGLYLGPPGRWARRFFSGRRIAELVVDVPQVNQFAIARRAAIAGRPEQRSA
jgi:SAM-dependent methyltransferase